MAPARIALALGSGGARGYAHIGVIEELQHRGYEIVSVAGSSMGAVVGGMLAAGRLERYKEWVLGLSHADVLRQLDPSLTTKGIFHAERVVARMVELSGDRRIEDLPIRFTAVAVDLLAGREVWLDEGPLDRAIRASIGIPGVVTPVVLDGRILVDGGVLDPVPVAATATSHADLVVAVSLQGQRRRPVRGAPHRETAGRRPEVVPSVHMREVLGLSLDAAAGALARHCLAVHPPDVLVTVPKDACQTLDFHKAAELIDLGRELARQALDLAQTQGV